MVNDIIILNTINAPIVIDDIDEIVSQVNDEVIDANSITVSNIPDSKNPANDVNALLWTGLSLNVQAKTVRKLETKSGKTRLKVELYSVNDKLNILKKKTQLRYTNEYFDVFIDSYRSPAEILMHQNFRTLLQTLPESSMYDLTNEGRLFHNTNKAYRN